MTLQNFKTLLSPAVLKKALKGVVRECDEPVKSHYIAFVSAGKDTFDVSITLNRKEEIKEACCDCTSKSPFCEHKAALLFFIGNSSKRKPGLSIVKKKKFKAEILLDTLDPEDLKKWFGEQLLKNKELEITFLSQFVEPGEVTSPGQVTESTLSVVKAVVKNKRNLDVSEVKKIVGLWSEIQEPIITQFYTYVNDINAFSGFHAVVQACEYVMHHTQTSSNRIVKYLEKLVLGAYLPIAGQKDDLAWAHSIGNFAGNLYTENNEIRLSYMHLLVSMQNKQSPERLKRYALVLLEKYKVLKNKSADRDEPFTRLVFTTLKKNGLLKDHLSLFKPSMYNNDFNNDLINELMNDGRLELAERYCIDQIDGKLHNRIIYSICSAFVRSTSLRKTMLNWL